MGFSTFLQGKTAHEALLGRQEAELRLMETMRRCLTLRAKCDREYAAALTSVSSQGLRGALEQQDLLSGSLVAQAWRSAMEEIENLGRLIRQNADQLEEEAVKQLSKLQVDKRKARKEYRDGYAKIASMFVQLSEDVSRKKGEYYKSLEAYKIARMRFEDHYVKSGRSGRKLDEVCDKYQKACRRLHLIHNEYVLLLSEVREFEHEHRTVLLPGLLDCQQTVQEASIDRWQSILLEAFRVTNFSSKKFQEIHGKMESGFEAVLPSAEYTVFLDKYKTDPISPVSFIFDQELLEGISGKLQPDVVAVDNLTIDWLRNKVVELETSLQEQQQLLKEKESILTHVKMSTPQGNTCSGGGSSQSQCAEEKSNERHPSISEGSSSSATLLSLQREVNDLKCSERKLKHLVEVIKKPLADLGCEEAPPGCDLSMSLNSLTSDILENSSEPQTPSLKGSQLLKNKLHAQRFVTLLRKPFHRKSSLPQSCLSTPMLEKRSVLRRGTCDGGRMASNEDNLKSSLADEEWFHGCLPREEVVRLLTQDGDFLVRETIRNDERQTVLSVNWCGPKHFIVQTTPEGHFRFEGPTFPDVKELINYQFQSGLPVTARSGAILRRAIPRERWELNNDDVVLDVKIGRGNFGDVFKAHLKPDNIDVAVKTCRLTLPEEQRRKFLLEGRILKRYDHPNIVKFIGICVQKQPIMIVMELVPGGSLLTYLRNHAAFLPLKQLLQMCRDVAAGMQYLESKNCIHRDLAARNCLVGHENIVKISDFGMSREEEEYIVSDGMKQIPIKWTAPEALHFGKYTSLCDVWSYGVLAWEIFACGGVPYSGLNNTKAREKIDSGYRMPAPEGTPPELYQLMLRCWEYEPEKRPHFDEIFTIVDKVYSTL
ncbi:tyrosine-protein kinase Fer isoform X2 [Ischnura elegans]|uniref:tyrosine-protein kinase Fer isoform X2 n=1 Tax=Ischnura elegans TaxID=197161 RepID=UPI001ED8B5B9|nr:tyrosine-protein kinase Fer isoform X2 [Ischnura elegans]